MKKKILFIDKSFAVGGIQSSMMNMLRTLRDEGDYEIDLYVYHPEGTLKGRLPEGIRVIAGSWAFDAIGMSFRECIKKGSFKQILFRLFATGWTKLFGNGLPIKLAMKTQKKLGRYDVAIAYHHESDKKNVCSGFARFADGCVDADVKLAWIHYDPEIVHFNERYNDRFYQKMDRVVCVSKCIKEKFLQYHAGLKDKVDYCYNFMDYEKIYKMSEQPQEHAFESDKLILFSASRLAHQKAVPRGVHALSPVLKKYGNIVWYIAGDGAERQKVEEAIREEGSEKYIKLLGDQSNPYPYIKNADLLMVLSYHEAAAMVFMEAKALSTPVFSTKVSSVEELLEEGVNAYVCENSEEGIRNKFEELMKDQNAIFSRRDNHKDVQPLDNALSIAKFKQMVEEIETAKR